MQRNGITILCEWCGQSRYRPQSHLRTADSYRFCSADCRNAYLRTPDVFFWPKVHKTDGCWLWTGALEQDGYGFSTVWIAPGGHGYVPGSRKRLRIHRFSYELHYGQILDDQWICHSCEGNYPPGDLTYRRCVRPEHLYAGTNTENVRNRTLTGRHRGPVGEVNGMAKLSELDVREILAMRKAGIPAAVIAERFRITWGHIYAIGRGVRWKNVR